MDFEERYQEGLGQFSESFRATRWVVGADVNN
jgi:hypothetical protein